MTLTTRWVRWTPTRTKMWCVCVLYSYKLNVMTLCIKVRVSPFPIHVKSHANYGLKHYISVRLLLYSIFSMKILNTKRKHSGEWVVKESKNITTKNALNSSLLNSHFVRFLCKFLCACVLMLLRHWPLSQRRPIESIFVFTFVITVNKCLNIEHFSAVYCCWFCLWRWLWWCCVWTLNSFAVEIFSHCFGAQ